VHPFDPVKEGSMPEQNLIGKAALVTGGSRGIGAAVALRLASAGADVAISYLNSTDAADSVVAQIKNSRVRAASFRADQADPAQVATMVREVVDTLGPIDILVNNAGIIRLGTLTDADLSGRTEQWAVNVEGVVTTTREVVTHMPDGGRVILLSTIAASRVSTAGFGDYAAGKAAVRTYGQAWAHDLAPRGITVNTIEAGFIDTSMAPPADSDFGRAMLNSIPLGRYGRTEEIADVIAFVAGPQASYMTGSTIGVDGGWNA
jgi:3-oxoacyl-[acyl-carrier protein] reductase